MKSIEEYIELSKSKENISDGGSFACDFGDVILIKYTYLFEEEDALAEIVNEKNALSL